jgi:hypothetical protein
MKLNELIFELLQVSNGLTLVGIAISVLALVLAGWVFYVPRKLDVAAAAKPPFLNLDPSKRPFTVSILNKNTRQVKVEKIGFETFMRPMGYFEYTYGSGLLKTEKLMVTEADHTEITFDANAVVRDIARSLADHTSSYQTTMFKAWLYLTHGSRIAVEVEPLLEAEIRAAISVAVAEISASRAS